MERYPSPRKQSSGSSSNSSPIKLQRQNSSPHELITGKPLLFRLITSVEKRDSIQAFKKFQDNYVSKIVTEDGRMGVLILNEKEQTEELDIPGNLYTINNYTTAKTSNHQLLIGNHQLQPLQQIRGTKTTVITVQPEGAGPRIPKAVPKCSIKELLEGCDQQPDRCLVNITAKVVVANAEITIGQNQVPCTEYRIADESASVLMTVFRSDYERYPMNLGSTYNFNCAQTFKSTYVAEHMKLTCCWYTAATISETPLSNVKDDIPAPRTIVGEVDSIVEMNNYDACIRCFDQDITISASGTTYTCNNCSKTAKIRDVKSILNCRIAVQKNGGNIEEYLLPQNCFAMLFGSDYGDHLNELTTLLESVIDKQFMFTLHDRRQEIHQVNQQKEDSQ